MKMFWSIENLLVSSPGECTLATIYSVQLRLAHWTNLYKYNKSRAHLYARLYARPCTYLITKLLNPIIFVISLEAFGVVLCFEM